MIFNTNSVILNTLSPLKSSSFGGHYKEDFSEKGCFSEKISEKTTTSLQRTKWLVYSEVPLFCSRAHQKDSFRVIVYDRLEYDAHCVCYEGKSEARRDVPCQVVYGTGETILCREVGFSAGRGPQPLHHRIKEGAKQRNGLDQRRNCASPQVQ